MISSMDCHARCHVCWALMFCKPLNVARTFTGLGPVTFGQYVYEHSKLQNRSHGAARITPVPYEACCM